METNAANSWPYRNLKRAQLDKAEAEISARLKHHGRADDRDLFIDLSLRVVGVRTSRGDVLMLRVDRAREGAGGRLEPVWTAFPIGEAIDLFLSPDNDERLIKRRSYELQERERAGVEEMAIRQEAAHAALQAKVEHERRLDAWAARPKVERALLQLDRDKKNTPAGDVIRAIEREPEVPTELPPGDVDLLVEAQR
jgi:hypothetical protein